MDENKNKPGSYSQLTGYKRAIPIILMALAIFIALCFITKNTGAFGAAISDLLLGLFSVGAFFIPAALVAHSIFYPSDVVKKRVLSRIIFTVITLLTISTLTHTIASIGDGISFNASELYSAGKDIKGGGFIGGALAFILTKVFGTVGVIVIAVALFAIYIAFYFSTSRSFLSKVLLKILTGISNFFTGISDKKNSKKDKKEKERNLKTRARIEEELAPLTDDEFFDADSGMREIRIPKLNIVETRDEREFEKNPHLQDKVFHKSDASKYSAESTSSRSYTQTDYYENTDTQRRVNMEYSTVDSVHGLANSVEETVFVPRKDDIVYESPKAARTNNADDVFSSGFEPFNLRMNEELSNKPSSKTVKENVGDDGITEFAEPINEISAEDIERARQRADFEMKKKAAIEAQMRYDRAKQEDMRTQRTEQGSPATPSREESEPVSRSFEAASRNFETVTEIREPATTPAQEYAAEFSFGTEPKQAYEEPKVEESTTFVTEPVTEFKEYTVPTTDGRVNETPQADSHDDVLKVTRSMLDPVFTSEETEEEDEPAASLEFESEQPSRVEFEFDTEDDEEEESFESVQEAPEDDGEDMKPIPPEEQNPEVYKQREYFNFFNEGESEEKDAEEIVEATVSATGFDSFDSSEHGDAEEENPDSLYESKDDGELVEDDDEDEDDTPPFEFSAPKAAPVQPKKPPEPAPASEEKPDYSSYQHPPLDLLVKGKFEEDVNQEEEKNQNAEKLVDALAQFNIRVSIKGVDRGPRITRYEIVPARGVKVNSIISLFNDIALNLGVEGMRMEAPIPGKSAIGVEIPNKKPSTVLLRDLVESDEFMCSPSTTLSCLGKDVTGNPVYADISKMPHVLVAGATGMGKSVCINAILISILYKSRPDEVKLIMIDPKKVEFNGYNGIPHLLVPVVTDVKQAAGALMWAVEQMEKRYDLMEAHEVRKIDAYNDLVRENPSLGEPLPKIIIVIDELNDIMIQAKKPAEDLIMSIAQKARAAGIHLIIGTQRPSVDVLTGVIKANIPTRIACKVASYNDSKTILEQAGAEKLLNNGDMLYSSPGTPKPLRVQGAFVSDGEVSAIMRFLKSQAKGAIYDSQALEEINRAAQKCSNKGKGGDFDDDDDDDGESGGLFSDPKFIEAVEIAIKSRKVATSLLQRKISIGYSKAAKYIDAMEEQGFVSEANGSKPREVLISMDEWHEIRARREI